MKKKRKAVLKAARKHGWNGSSLESLKTWAFDQGITEFGTSDGTIEIDELDDIFVAKRLKIDISDDDDDGDPIVNDNRGKAEGDDPDDDDDIDNLGDVGKSRRKSRHDRHDQQDGSDWASSLNPNRKAKTDRTSAKRMASIMARKKYNKRAAMGKTAFLDADEAELWTAKTRIEMAGPQDYPLKKYDQEILAKAGATYDGTLGGVLIPDGYSTEIINTNPQYGTARDLVGTYDMTRPKEFIPRFGNSVSFSKVAEGSASSETQPSFDGVYLESEEISGLVILPLRLMEQSPLNVADILFKDIDNAQREYEDRAFWLGTDNWAGLATKIGAGSRHTVSGLSSLASITPTDMMEFAAQLPDRVDRFADDIGFYCHRSVDMLTFGRFVTQAGGATEDDLTQKPRPQFHGIDINHVNVLPSGRTFSSGTDYLYVGPTKRACKFGILQGSQRFAQSEQRYIEKRQWCAVVSVEIAVNCHEVNDTDDSMVFALNATS